MLIEDFNQTLDSWIKELDQYSFTQLLAKPSETSWSLGQMYMHLIDVTIDYFEEAQICASTNDNINKEATATGKAMLRNSEFPDEIIEGPPSNADTPQPFSKKQIRDGLFQLKNELIKVKKLLAKNQLKGKTKHIGLGYFNANEWLQFAEMHFRHHLRQKKRLDGFLKTNTNNG